MSGPRTPDLTLAELIIKGIARYTGREVRGAEIYAFHDHLTVTVALGEDGVVEVGFSDPEAPDGAPSDATSAVQEG